MLKEMRNEKSTSHSLTWVCRVVQRPATDRDEEFVTGLALDYVYSASDQSHTEKSLHS